MNRKAKVYFTKTIAPEMVVTMFERLGVALAGNVADKVHSGEAGNQNFLRPEFMKAAVEHVNGTIVECNTAYPGKRAKTHDHWNTIKDHGWTDVFNVDIMDEDGEFELPVPNGKQIKKNFVGDHLKKYDSMLVLSHFKGHGMGGFGGALKNISIGIASAHGKAYIHGAGDESKAFKVEQDAFLESMADACKSIADYYGDNIVYVNIMKNLSVSCDCDANAPAPCMADIGILSSTDPVALDQACHDLVYAADDPGKKELIQRMESLNAIHIVDTAVDLGVGTREYDLSEVA